MGKESDRVTYKLSTIGTEPSAPPCLCSGFKHRHPTLGIIWVHGGQLKRREGGGGQNKDNKMVTSGGGVSFEMTAKEG